MDYNPLSTLTHPPRLFRPEVRCALTGQSQASDVVLLDAKVDEVLETELHPLPRGSTSCPLVVVENSLGELGFDHSYVVFVQGDGL